MSIRNVPEELRGQDKFHHIDMGFLNRRLCMSALPSALRLKFIEHQKPGDAHMTVLANDHLLVTMLLDSCESVDTPTLLLALALEKRTHLFRSTERLAPCPEVYEEARVCHAVQLDLDFGKPIYIAYHTEHLVSTTGKMVLAGGAREGYINSMVGLLHHKESCFEIDPLVIGQPWFEHPRNGTDSRLMFLGPELGEVLPEDIDQFCKMSNIEVESDQEWRDVMKSLPEADVRKAFASLFSEPTKKDWGGEANDHFSGNISIHGQRRTAAFLLKGPSQFREMTLEMCGKRADQIHRLVDSAADVSIIQHSHLIGSVVRRTLRNLTIYPGGSRRKYCLIDGQATYRILKSYSLL